MTFKVGDKVKRQEAYNTTWWKTVCKRDRQDPYGVYTVTKVGDVSLNLAGFSAESYMRNYELVESAEEQCLVVPNALDTQVSGTHYKDMGLQPLEACYQRYGYAGVKAAIHTKVDKYFREKENIIEDLEKAKHCIELLIEFAKREGK